MPWRVEVLNETVAQELDALPEAMKARYLRIVRLIAEMGLEFLGAPYVKHLKEKLWEMRLRGRDGISRALYVTAIGQRVVVLRVL